MKRWIEYAIFHKYEDDPEPSYWEGTFRTAAAVQRQMRHYRYTAPDFFAARITYEPLEIIKRKKR
jgi:hypothetical protein